MAIVLTGVVLLILLLLLLSRRTHYPSVIGLKVKLLYSDQNVHFESIMPLKGCISEILKVGSNQMFAIDLDNSFVYLNREYSRVVVKERHVGVYIGQASEVHVHVCLPKVVMNKTSYDIKDFDHVVWAIVKT